MIDRPDSKLGPGDKPGARPAIHRCGACNVRVNPEDDDDMHVCVPDDAGPIKAHGRSWRATTAKAAHEDRLKKEGRGGGRP